MPALSGIIERVTFRSEESGFSVIQVRVRGQKAPVTMVGSFPPLYAGESVTATGEWKNDKTHGMQFDASQLSTDLPQDRMGLEKYLGSGVVRGIGPGMAKVLVKEFGTEVMTIIEKQPERLRSVAGIGPKRVEQIRRGWEEQRDVRELMIFLHSHGVGTARASRIHRTYGGEAISLITENPYRVADEIRGMGFLSADQLAQRLGFEKNSLARARAGVSWVLSESRGEGHCALPRAELIRRSIETLSIDKSIIEDAIRAEVAEEKLVADTIDGHEAIFTTRLWYSEGRIAREIARLKGRPPWPGIDAEKAIPWVEEKLEIELAPSQRSALAGILASKQSVLTGGPGVGKTTLMNSLIRIVRAKSVKVLLCAPTGRAARRLSESTSMEAKTIHRLLEVNGQAGGFKRNEAAPLECDLLVVDESSMIDVPLMEAILRALPSHAAVLFVGDVDQLPSVGPGQVLSDLIESGTVLVVRLTEVFRQAASSRIITNAHRVNSGEMPRIERDEDSDFYFVKAEDPERAAQMVLRMVAERIPQRFPFDPIRDVQVLSPMNRGTVGVKSLNEQLQRLLNQSGQSGPSVERMGQKFLRGDKVMQTENDYENEVFNGDLGIVEEIDGEAEEVIVHFDDKRVKVPFSDLDSITLAYATTIHKSQGSEYPAVVIPILNQHYVMLQRNLLYTAMTRARKLVVLIGQESAIRAAVENRRSGRRWSRLKEALQEQRRK